MPHLPSVSLLANAYMHCLNEVSLSPAEVAAAAAGLKALGQSPGTAEKELAPGVADQVWGLVKAGSRRT